MVTLEETETVGAMRRYGGSFVKALADAFTAADAENFAKLRAAFPDYWEKYRAIAAEGKANPTPNTNAPPL